MNLIKRLGHCLLWSSITDHMVLVSHILLQYCIYFPDFWLFHSQRHHDLSWAESLIIHAAGLYLLPHFKSVDKRTQLFEKEVKNKVPLANLGVFTDTMPVLVRQGFLNKISSLWILYEICAGHNSKQYTPVNYICPCFKKKKLSFFFI